MNVRSILVAALFATTVACAGGPTCDAAQLRSQLDGAAPGTEVQIGSCRIELSGTLSVPAGVHLRGQGAAVSTIAGAGAEVVLVLSATGAGTSISDLTIESSSSRPAVYVARGTEAPTLTNVRINATRGIALAGQMVDAMSVSSLELVGPVTEIGLLPVSPTVENTATHGILFVQVGRGGRQAILEEVTLRGFASRGAEFVESDVVWRGGDASGNYGIGIMYASSTGDVEDVSVDETDGSSTGIVPPYAVVVSEGSQVTTTRLSVTGTDGYGVLLDGSAVQATDTTVSTARDVGVWSQDEMSMELSGDATMIDGNGGAGIVSRGTMMARVEDGTIQMTALRPRVEGTMGRIDIGDAIQTIGASTIIRLAQLRLLGNERTGLLFELEGGALDSELTAVTIEGEGTALGAIAQHGTIPGGWDTGVTRGGATLANDAAFTGTLDFVQTRVTVPAVDLAGVDGI